MASGSHGTNLKAPAYDNKQADAQGTPVPSSVRQFGLNSKISNPKHHNYMGPSKTPASPSKHPQLPSFNRVVSKPPPSTSFNRVVSKPPPSTSSAPLPPNMFNSTSSYHDNPEEVKSRPAEQFRSAAGGAKEYSIWQKSSYLGSYQLPPSPLSANLPPYPFPVSSLRQTPASPSKHSQSTSFNRVVSKPLPSTSSARLPPNMFDSTSSYHDNREVKSSPTEQFRSAAGGAKEYSIWQKSSYLGSYQLPPSPLSTNLPPYPFPGMGPKKLFNPKLPLHHHDNVNHQRMGTDNENPN